MQNNESRFNGAQKGVLWAVAVAAIGTFVTLGIGYVKDAHDASITAAEKVRVLEAEMKDMKEWREGIQADRANRGYVIPDHERRIQQLERKR